jgi:hypothetical protein
MVRLFVVRSNTATLPESVAAAIEHTLPQSSADLRAQACEHFDRACDYGRADFAAEGVRSASSPRPRTTT